jgi:hypothetical protein
MNEILYIPIGLAILLLLFGMRGGWRRLFFGLALSYAAVVLACQNYKRVTSLDWFRVSARIFEPQQQAAVAFSLALITATIVLNILYSMLWRPVEAKKPSGGLLALLRGIVLGAVGWTLGILITLGLFPLLRIENLTSTPLGNWYWNTAKQTLVLVSSWVEPWLIEPGPLFLLVE